MSFRRRYPAPTRPSSASTAARDFDFLLPRDFRSRRRQRPTGYFLLRFRGMIRRRRGAVKKSDPRRASLIGPSAVAAAAAGENRDNTGDESWMTAAVDRRRQQRLSAVRRRRLLCSPRAVSDIRHSSKSPPDDQLWRCPGVELTRRDVYRPLLHIQYATVQLMTSPFHLLLSSAVDRVNK